MSVRVGFKSSFRPETALLRNLSVNLPDFLCDVRMYVSAQSVDFLDLAQNCSFPTWKRASSHPEFPDGNKSSTTGLYFKVLQ